MGEINFQVFSQFSHTSIYSIKKIILIKVILWIEPFFFQFSPHCFSNVQMRGVWREKEDVQTPLLPIRNALHNDFCLMQTGIIQHNKRLLINLKRKIFHIFQYKLSIYVAFGCFTPTPAFSVYETKAVKLISFFRQNTNLLIRKLPSIRNITFTAHMSFITIIQIYLLFSAHLFKFFKFLHLKDVMFRQRQPFGATPYAFISSAKLLKKP